MASNPERPPDAQTVACPCGHGDVPAELAGQRPLLERAAAGDREAFARLYDDQVEGVYRYLLAWTGDRAEAAELTGQVFRAALSWLTLAAGGEGEAGAWLIAMARDTVAHRRGPGRARWAGGSTGAGGSAWPGGQAGTPGAATTGAVAAVARLGDPEREVVVLRLLLGHSVAHTAHLSGYGQRAVLELQLAACLAIRELTGAAQAGPAASEGQPASAEEFERRLGRWEVDLAGGDPVLTGGDPVLTGALAAAGSLRQAVPGHVVAPDPDLVAHLRRQLVSGEPSTPPGGPVAAPAPPGAPAPGAPAAAAPDHGPRATPPVPGRGPRWGSVADRRAWESRSSPGSGARSSPGSGARSSPGSGSRWSRGSGEGVVSRRPWVATGVAVAGIVLVLSLQAFGEPARPPSPASTTAVAAGGGSLGPALTSVVQPSTTSSTQPASGSAATVPRTSAATAPPTTRPATTTPPTTAPRPTTTRAPTTTTPPTTVATTTTTPPTTT